LEEAEEEEEEKGVEDDTKPCSRPQLFPNQSLTS
jgi:hypothetical protein